MNEKIKEIAARIKELRELSGISASEMAKSLRIDEKTYSGYESAVEDIPVGVLYDAAQKLKVDMGLLLTGEDTRMHIFTVTRKGEGVKVERGRQYDYSSLAEKFVHKKAETLLVTVEPRDGKPDYNAHPGQEFDYLLEGRMKVYINDNEIVLEEGDSIFFDSGHPHAMEALDCKKARFLAVVM